MIMISFIRIKIVTAFTLILILTVNCTSNQKNKKNQDNVSKSDSCSITVQAEDYVNSKSDEAVKFSEKNIGYLKVNAKG